MTCNLWTTVGDEFSNILKNKNRLLETMEYFHGVIHLIFLLFTGTVDATIDQLLAMSTDVENERLRTQLEAQDPVGSTTGAGGTRTALQQTAYQSPVRYNRFI